jgi:hypothetical protein
MSSQRLAVVDRVVQRGFPPVDIEGSRGRRRPPGLAVWGFRKPGWSAEALR